MANTFYIFKTQSGNYYEIQEEKSVLGKKKWWIFFKGEKLEVVGLQNGEMKRPKHIDDFLGYRPVFGPLARTSRVKAIYILKRILN